MQNSSCVESLGCSAQTILSPMDSFIKQSHEFAAHHQDPFNSLSHLFCASLIIFAILALVRSVVKSSSFVLTLLGVYLISLLNVLSIGEMVATIAITCFSVNLARKLQLSTLVSTLAIGTGYLLQYLAHEMSGEALIVSLREVQSPNIQNIIIDSFHSFSLSQSINRMIS